VARTLTLFAILALASAACDELSSVDDPRESDSFVDEGYCSGIELYCEQLSETACAAARGCAWGDGCYGSERDQCFSRTSESSCPETCDWSDEDNVCYGPRFGDLCDSATSQSRCESGLIGPCLWGKTCTGNAASCYSFDDRGSCLRQPGCAWR
jgi:hypothetical protein